MCNYKSYTCISLSFALNKREGIHLKDVLILHFLGMGGDGVGIYFSSF